MPPRSVKWYGWIPDLPDHRDLMYAAPLTRKPLKAKLDLREHFKIDAYDQGELGSCTGNAIAAAVQFARQKARKKPDFIPSRLFIYYNERVMEGTVDEDSGAQIRDGIKSVAKVGVCPEESHPKQPYDWRYVIGKFTQKPPEACYTFAKDHQIVSYRRLTHSLTSMRACLASGYPFVFGFTVYDSFESQQVAQTGIVPLPESTENVLGGHAVLAMGYDDQVQRFLVRNSWGTDWGQKGYFEMPYAYLADSNLADDFWTIRLVEG